MEDSASQPLDTGKSPVEIEFCDLSKTWSCECPSDREILGLGACGKARMCTTATIPDLATVSPICHWGS